MGGRSRRLRWAVVARRGCAGRRACAAVTKAVGVEAVNVLYEERVQQLFDLARLVEEIFQFAGLEYRLCGGMATFLYVEEALPDAGRTTRDIDIVVRRDDLEKIARAAEHFGYRYRHVAGVDMLLKEGQSPARRAVHMVFAGEKVRPDYLEAVPALGPRPTVRGLRLIPLVDLVRMKLTSFRLKDQVHIQDLDEAGVITAEIEAALTPELRERLGAVRARA